MNKSATMAMAVLVLTAAGLSHLGAATSDRPSGVAERNWIPVSNRFGFVISAPEEAPVVPADPQALLLAPTARGYFMIKGAGGWIRAIVIDPIKGPGNTG